MIINHDEEFLHLRPKQNAFYLFNKEKQKPVSALKELFAHRNMNTFSGEGGRKYVYLRN